MTTLLASLRLSALFLTAVFTGMILPAQAQTSGKIVATIAPLHSILSNILPANNAPLLLLKQHQDAHHASLRPSQMRMLDTSSIIFRIGPGLEGFLNNIVRDLEKTRPVISVIEAPGVVRLRDENNIGDPHIWLSTQNALKIAAFATDKLELSTDTDKPVTGEKGLRLADKIRKLHKELETELAGIKGKKFLADHNGLNYFGSEFGLLIRNVRPGYREMAPGARAISAFRKLVNSGEYQCLIAGSNSHSAAFRSIAKDALMPVVVIDPMGSQFTAGREQYFQMMRDIARQLTSCSR